MTSHSRLDILNAALSRRELIKRAGLGAATLTLSGFLDACAVGSSSPSPQGFSNKEIETLNWALSTPIVSLDIAKANDANSEAVINLGLETLVTYNSDLKLVPLLAESWTRPEPLRYVFKIRSGVTFWDGTPLTAEDAAFSIGRHLDPGVASQWGSFFTGVKAFEASGPLELTVHMLLPDSLLPYYLILGQVTPKVFTQAQGQKFGSAAGSTITTMGTGPFRFTSYQADEGITAVRNDTYWGKKPVIKNLNVKVIQDSQTRQLAMRSGEIDGTFGIPLQEADQWSRIQEAKTLLAPGMVVWFIVFNVNAAPWNDIHVRRAFAYCCDREGIVKALVRGHGKVANSIVPPEQWSGLLPRDQIDKLYAQLRDYPFSIDKAKAELAQSSVPTGFSATIENTAQPSYVQDALLSISQNLKQIGINLEVKTVNQDQATTDLYARNFGIQITAYLPDYPDPADYLAVTYPSSAAVPNACCNYADYKNPTVDSLLTDSATTTSADQHAKDLAQVMQISNEDLPYFSLWWEDAVGAISSKYVYSNFTGLWFDINWALNIHSAT